MCASEFDIIKQYFSPDNHRDDVVLAGGDDCAIVKAPANTRLAITTDTLISGVHFPPETCAEDIAYKSLAVNFSDLAAMGATPAWVSLAITLPETDHSWLAAFSSQFNSLLHAMGVTLTGGDTTRGALSISVTAIGFLPQGRGMQRDFARPSEKIFVTGTLGDAAVGLRCVQNNIRDERLSCCISKLNRPDLLNSFAQDLCGYSNCAVDISDGLLADLGHVLKASGCGARIQLAMIPLSDSVRHYCDCYAAGDIDWSLVLSHGDDYQLCFTLPETQVAAVKKLADEHAVQLSCIGEITESGTPGMSPESSTTGALVCINEEGAVVDCMASGYLHFG